MQKQAESYTALKAPQVLLNSLLSDVHEPKVIRDDIRIARVEKQSVGMHLSMHLEEKEAVTQGHEPKVIRDDSILATVETQRVGYYAS